MEPFKECDKCESAAKTGATILCTSCLQRRANYELTKRPRLTKEYADYYDKLLGGEAMTDQKYYYGDAEKVNKQAANERQRKEDAALLAQFACAIIANPSYDGCSMKRCFEIAEEMLTEYKQCIAKMEAGE